MSGHGIVKLYRGRSVESVCPFIWVAAARPNDLDQTKIFARSTLKPFQAAACLEILRSAGVRPNLRQLAVACGSHHGTREALLSARTMLKKANLISSQLACPAAYPFCTESGTLGPLPSRLHHNCSGKHALMAWTSRVMGWPVRDYHLPDHPLQIHIRRRLCDYFGYQFDEDDVGTDGCGLPTFRLPLASLAAGYVRLISDRPHIEGRIVESIRKFPHLLSSEVSPLCRLMERRPVIAKDGAEGVGCVVSLRRKRALAFKVLGGNHHATVPVFLFLSRMLGKPPTSTAGSSLMRGAGWEVSIVGPGVPPPCL